MSTQKSNGHANDTAFGVFDFDGSDIVDLAAERASDDGNIAMSDRNTMFTNDTWCESNRAGCVFVVSNLSWYGLSIGPYQVRLLVVLHNLASQKSKAGKRGSGLWVD